MILSLHIENIAIVKTLDIDLSGGLVLENILGDDIQDLGLLSRLTTYASGISHHDDGKHDRNGKEGGIKATKKATGNGQRRYRSGVGGGHSAVAKEEGGNAKLTELENTRKHLDDLRQKPGNSHAQKAFVLKNIG